ncbi:MAG: GNAT family N-acetyltransferase [Halomonas sp. BM-2019]|nr:MAG: GNAT family N-acetyltransferase [Halomonas sp. BM-2019]
MLEPVFRAGETYAVPRGISEQDAHRMWVELPRAVRVAEDETGTLLGTYTLKANQAGPGDHVANCGYIVSPAARGRGVAGQMCEHSLTLARELGFTAMQYNLVVASNAVAVRLWQRHGFAIAGTLPRAFRHPERGPVDAHVMYRLL